MKKLFRFQYEKCNGTCYAPEDTFKEALKNVPEKELETLIMNIVEAHDSTCDDPEQRFSVDYDENNKIFIGSFINGKTLDLFSDKSFVNLINSLTSHVIKENKNKIITSDQCVYGNNGNENLAEKILKLVA